MESRLATLNAKVAGVSLVIGAILLHAVNQLDFSLQPVRLIIIATLIMGAWAFSDEMGLRKPLNRAAFVCFAGSMLGLTVTVLEPEKFNLQTYVLLYSMALLFAVLIWSAAFLHRQKDLKVVGAVGAFASVLPLLALIVGHLSIGAGAVLGVQVLLKPEQGASVLSSGPVQLIEVVFILWSLATAIFLWRGKMSH